MRAKKEYFSNMGKDHQTDWENTIRKTDSDRQTERNCQLGKNHQTDWGITSTKITHEKSGEHTAK